MNEPRGDLSFLPGRDFLLYESRRSNNPACADGSHLWLVQYGSQQGHQTSRFVGFAGFFFNVSTRLALLHDTHTKAKGLTNILALLRTPLVI